MPMKAEQLTDGGIFIEFDLKAGNRLVDAVIKHATHMPSAALDLSSGLPDFLYQWHRELTASSDFVKPG